jgi:hypothetical protein
LPFSLDGGKQLDPELVLFEWELWQQRVFSVRGKKGSGRRKNVLVDCTCG